MGLREILLISIVAVLCGAALVRPRLGVFGYIWYATARPDILAWVPDQYNFSACLAIATLVGALPYIGELKAILQSPISRWLVILQVPLVVSVAFAVDQSLSFVPYVDYLKSIVILLLVPVFVTTKEHLKQLLLVIALSLGVVAVKFGLYGALHGGVILIQGYGGQLSDNNLLGLGLVMGVPVMWYGLRLSNHGSVKLMLAACLVLNIAAIVMTNSRGSNLTLGVILLLMTLRAKRKVAVFVLLAVCVGGAVYSVRDQYSDRMATIATFTEEASAYSRIEHAIAAFNMWLDYPTTGVGFGGRNYAGLASRYLGRENIHVAHNSYLQMLVDSGPAAFLIYVGLLFGTVRSLGLSAKEAAMRWPGEQAVPWAIQTSLFAFAIGGTFYSSQKFDLPVIFLMCAAAWHHMVRRAAISEEATTSESSEVGGRLVLAEPLTHYAHR